MHIAITGNIGAGKTTLAHLLASQYGWGLLEEAVEENPYLVDFYKDMERWSFNLQIYFLNSRFEQVIRMRESTYGVVQDRTIYEDAHVFAKSLYDSKLMSEPDYLTYRRLFDTMMSFVAPPDLLIYLRVGIPKLMRQIRLRGRTYEESISEDYLRRLNWYYDEFIAEYKEGKILVVEADELDFSNESTDLRNLIEQVNRRVTTY